MLIAHLLLVVLGCARPAQAVQDKAAEFQSQFDAALAARDNDGMDRLLQRYKDQAIDLFLLKADARAASPAPALDQWVDGFVASWDRVFKTPFARNYDRYLQLLDAQRRAGRAKLLSQVLAPLNTRHIEAIDKKDSGYWQPIQIEVESLINGLEQTGDLYFLAFACNIKGNAWNLAYNQKGGDNKKALDAYTRCVQARERLGLTNDAFYASVKGIRAEVMSVLGIPDPDAPKGTPAKPKAPPEAIPPVEGTDWANFELQPGFDDRPEQVSQPSDLADLERHSWLQFSVQDPGTAVEIPLLEPKVSLRRRGLNEFVLDGGAALSEPFALQPKPAVVEYERKHADGSVSGHALMLACGSEQDSFQGATLNLALRSEKGSVSTVFVRSVATRTGRTPFGDITFYDLNGDGQFGYSELKQVGENGLIPDTWLYRYDAVMLGKSKRAWPYSPWLANAKGEWFELTLPEPGKAASVRLRPVAPKLGSLKISFKGPKDLELASLVFVSESGATKGLTVDAAGGKGGVVTLPIGRYQFQQGLLRGKDGAEAIILPPASEVVRVDVEEGQAVALDFGAPFRLSVSGKVQGRQLLVDAKTLHVVGAAGERYERLVGAPLFNVEVFVKGGKSAKLAASGTDEMNSDWSRCFVPQDATLTLKEGEKTASVRLALKKHPWFGNLESDWIEVQ
ncbi:MAG: hypothetical protein EYC70_03930 [Planctomycetota bacterium]|nr:MAG: hypothetical protein EYC70_03930 [Planctomycetota bacterium]